MNYYLQAFGFEDFWDFLRSTFGHISTMQGVSFSVICGAISTFCHHFLGFDLFVFTAFTVLNVMEFRTGVKASKKKGQKVESRKMGRMFLKVGTYVTIIGILNIFQSHLAFPSVFNYELDPFIALYWIFFAGVIFQLLISLLENLVALDYAEAKGVLGIVVRKFNQYFGDDSNS